MPMLDVTENERDEILRKRAAAALPDCPVCNGSGRMDMRGTWRGCRWCDATGKLARKDWPFAYAP